MSSFSRMKGGVTTLPRNNQTFTVSLPQPPTVQQVQATQAQVQQSRQLPYIFVLDWDGTVAGRVDFQVHQFLLARALKKHGFRPIRTNEIPPAFYPNARLIRPGIENFMKAMNQWFGNEAYFFIYTASEKAWALQEIEWMEKTHGIKFMRPIFTRDDCTVDSAGNFRKSFHRIYPRILKSISRQRGTRDTFTQKERTSIAEERVLIVDNNAVYSDVINKLVICPDYNYAVFENLLSNIPQEARNHEIVKQFIYSMVNQGLLCPQPKEVEDGMRTLAQQYKWLARKCKSLVESNKQYENDNLWKNLSILIYKNQIRSFTPEVVRRLQDDLWKMSNKVYGKTNSTKAAMLQQQI